VRGDVLSPSASPVVDVSVIHPAADTYRRAAARTTGSAAACRDIAKKAPADPNS